MNLKSQMYQMGVSVSENMKPEAFVNAVLACPVLTQAYPPLGTLATNVQDLITGYQNLNNDLNTLENTIATTEDSIDSAQSAVNTANKVYTKYISTSPEAYTGSGVGTVVVTPSVDNKLFAEAIAEATDTLDNFKDELKKLKQKLEELKQTIEKYYNAMLERVKTYVKSIMNTRVG